jgi:Tfp pilus assembly protein PilV
MKTPARSERAQALILILLGMVALIGLTALSIDGGNAYSDRRHAQNAADTSALAAALAKVKDDSSWKAVGDNRANSNGYLDTDVTTATTSPVSNVEVYSCDEGGASCQLPGSANPAEYIQVVITSHVRTYFAQIVGVHELVNRVTAVAKAKPSTQKPWFDGNAIVALMPGCKTGDPIAGNHDPFTLSGNSTSIVGGSGVFVNSDCNNAINQNGASSMNINGGFSICSNGEPSLANYALGSINPPPVSCDEAQPYPPDDLIQFPNPTCSGAGTITLISASPKVYLATPGNFSGFPGLSGQGKLIMSKGVYCILGGDFDVHTQWVVTTDSNGNGAPGDTNEGAFIFVRDGAVTINGGATMNLSAMYSSDVPQQLRGVLFYLPLGNTNTVKLTGTSGSSFTGTVLAPSAFITIEGTSGSMDVNSQIIGYTVNTTGTGDVNIYYDQGLNSIATYNPQIELTK